MAKPPIDLQAEFDRVVAERDAMRSALITTISKPKLLPRNMADPYHRPYGAPAPVAGASDARPASRQARRVLARPNRPNAGVEARYRQRLDSLIGEMNASVIYWLKAQYRKTPPKMQELTHDDVLVRIRRRNLDDAGRDITDPSSVGMAFDRRTPAEFLAEAFARLRERWERKFDETAAGLAEWFAVESWRRSDGQLKRLLAQSPFSVKFQMTPAMRDVLAATTSENVALIKSIPSQYLTQVEGIVMRSVTAGRDLAPMVAELTEQFGVTKRRAAFIAINQNNQATANMTRVRQVELGLKAVWMHSHAGKEPRPTHLRNNGEPYDPAAGWFDPAERKRIWPGQLINCRCFTKTIVPGLS